MSKFAVCYNWGTRTFPYLARCMASPRSFGALLAKAPSALRVAMEPAGLFSPTMLRAFVGHMARARECLTDIVERDLDSDDEDDDELIVYFIKLFLAAEGPADRAHDSYALTSSFGLWHQRTRRDNAAAATARAAAQPSSSSRAGPPAARGGRWPSKRKRRVALAGNDERGRQLAEESARRKWVARLVRLLQQSDMPIVELAACSLDPAGTLARGAAGRRASTLRQRIHILERFKEYVFWNVWGSIPIEGRTPAGLVWRS